MGTTAEPGWYDDGTGKQRWWDGTRWTEHYVDMSEPSLELHADDTPPAAAPADAGWYDDQRGRLRWWDGTKWTAHSRFSGEEREFAGIVVDARWIHFTDLSQPVGGVKATFDAGRRLLSRSKFTGAAVDRILHGPYGRITPRLLKRSIERDVNYVVVDGPDQVWASPVYEPSRDAAARDFVTWINTASRHYLYR